MEDKSETNNPHIARLAKKLGISPSEVIRAMKNLLHGNGAVYRQIVATPLHGTRV